MRQRLYLDISDLQRMSLLQNYYFMEYLFARVCLSFHHDFTAEQ